MWMRHLGDPDAAAEYVLRRIGWDGMDMRDPAAVILALGWDLRELTSPGPEEGRVSEEHRTAYVRFLGDRRAIRRIIAHECGHIIQLEMGHRFPHCECCADQIGRAVCLGRRGIERQLRTEPPQQIVAGWEHIILPSEVARRIFEVRRTSERRTG
jgi:hypothetical protein